MNVERRDWDVIVIGLGALGSGAAYWASTRPGTRVLGLEQFEFGHPYGASEDHSRIIRLSYHRPDYVRLAKRAYETWAVVEAEAGERIVTQCGGLDLWPANPAIPMADYTASLAAEDVPFEILAAEEIMRRWPQWRLSDDVVGMWQAQGGLADPFKGNTAHRQSAALRGATLRDQSPVRAIRQVEGEVEVVLAGGESHRAGHVILAADAWTNALLTPLGRTLNLTITKEQVTYVSAPDPTAFSPDRFPVWIWMDDPSFYGFPTYGEAGPKIAQDCGGLPTTPETRTFDRDEAAHARARGFLANHLPGAVGPDIYTKTCLYTLTPDRDFVVDQVPEAPLVTVLLGAAHGFKFASVLGRIAAEMAFDGVTTTSADLGAFAIDRPILSDLDAVANWMV